jgi:hypothetical protein
LHIRQAKESYKEILVGNVKEKNYAEDTGVNNRTILKWI